MIIALLIFSVVAGALLGSYFGGHGGFAKSLLILSAGFLITICLTEVFPEVYGGGTPHVGIFVIGGVLLQLLLESFTKGFEHGHFHHHSDTLVLPLALLVGMFIHAFIEGMPLARETDIQSPYLLGIVFHNLPISFILGAYLFADRKFSLSSTAIVLVFALASPLGVFLGRYFSFSVQPYLLALVGGIFLHISSVIIFESNKNHNIDWKKILLVLVGVGLALTGHLFHHH